MDEAVLTNREFAAVIILVAIIGFVLTRPGRDGFLESIRAVLISLTEPSVLIPLLLYIGWISASVAGASRFGLWDLGLLKTTLLWLLVSGLALVMGLNDAIQKPGFFRRALIKTLGVVAIVEFIAALKSFPLWLEILGQFLVVVFAMVGVVAERDPQYSPVRKLANGYLVLFGVSAVIWSMTYLIGNWSTLDQDAILREFLLPIWLTPPALLFVYGFAVVAAYQGAFVRMRIWNKQGPLLRQRLAMMVRANGRLGYLRLLYGNGAQRIARTEGFLQAWREVGVLHKEARKSEAEKAATRHRTLVSKGVLSTGTSGTQPKRRRFENSVASGIAAPLNTSLRLALEQERVLVSAAEKLDRTKDEMEAMLRRVRGSHKAFQYLGPIETANLILLLAQRGRTSEEIELMALPIAMLNAISPLESVKELVEKFDRFLRLAGEPAHRAMNIADILTATTQASSATSNETLDAMIAFYEA
ncbi:MAG TPA: hypothetical protein VM754_04795 [Actinomycetota bacterium]|nr:hypothetical protein [Actinomycetota bacterium]